MATEEPTGHSLGRPADGPAGYPIGYWLKRLDAAIDAALESTLAADGLARRHWQTMNLLHEGPSGEARLTEALQPFWGQGKIALDEVLSDLERRTLVVNDEGLIALTAAGSATRSKIAEKVGVTRSQLIDGISREEYRTTVQVLQRMTTNLEVAAAS